jgi:hypothetical protein
VHETLSREPGDDVAFVEIVRPLLRLVEESLQSPERPMRFMVIGDGGRGGWDASSSAGLGSFQTLFKKFKEVNPQCNTICVNIKATSGKDVFDKSLNVLQISGWSDKIFNLIEANCKGYKALIDEIEKIKI